MASACVAGVPARAGIGSTPNSHMYTQLVAGVPAWAGFGSTPNSYMYTQLVLYFSVSCVAYVQAVLGV